MIRSLLGPVWAVAVAITWGLVVGGGMAVYSVADTEAALREAQRGRVLVAVGGAAIAGLALVVPRLGSRFPRGAIGLLVGSAVFMVATAASSLAASSGVLCALPVGIGVLLALRPRLEAR